MPTTNCHPLKTCVVSQSPGLQIFFLRSCMSSKILSGCTQVSRLARFGQSIWPHRAFRSTAPGRHTSGNGPESFGGHRAERWESKRASVYTGNSIIAVAAAAGAVGWGLAQVSEAKTPAAGDSQDKKQTVSRIPQPETVNNALFSFTPPQYATLDEMTHVSSLLL